jgi:predicted nuclease with TOPRIM domain
LAEKLKREFIELLEKDVEFRYTVAGYLGLSEILKRLDRHESHILEILKRLDRLEENQEKLWEEVRALREEQRKLWEGQNKLWEGQNKLWEGQSKLWEEYRRLRDYVKAGFRELGRVLGITFEAHAASFLEVLLEELGYPDARVEKKYLVSDGEVVEIDMFCERPLVVGEVTTHVATKDGARAEIEKLLSRVRLVEERYGRRVMLAVLVVSTATPEAHEELRRLATEHGIRLVFGREIEERLAV